MAVTVRMLRELGSQAATKKLLRSEGEANAALGRLIAKTVGVPTRDVVLVAGKGHETYQEVRGQRLPFSDVDQVQRALAAR